LKSFFGEKRGFEAREGRTEWEGEIEEKCMPIYTEGLGVRGTFEGGISGGRGRFVTDQDEGAICKRGN